MYIILNGYEVLQHLYSILEKEKENPKKIVIYNFIVIR